MRSRNDLDGVRIVAVDDRAQHRERRRLARRLDVGDPRHRPTADHHRHYASAVAEIDRLRGPSSNGFVGRHNIEHFTCDHSKGEVDVKGPAGEVRC